MSEDPTHISGVRRRSWWLAAVGLLVVLATIAVGIVLSRRQAERQILTNLDSRATTSAGFVSTFLSQQAERETQTARAFLSGRRTASSRFSVIVSSFGSGAAVLLDRSGRLLQVAPRDPKLIGSEIASHYAHLTAAEAGRTAVSGVVLSAVRHQPIVAIAVPYRTAAGRRVLSIAYPVGQTVLPALLQHATVPTPLRVMLIDGHGAIIAANLDRPGSTLGRVEPQLAAAVTAHPQGSVHIAGAQARYVIAPVPGTSWHLVLAVADRQLFVTVDGAARWLPWLVFSVLCAFGLIGLALFARALTTRAKLADLTRDLADAARTDPVTGLSNRRGLEEHLALAVAQARRQRQPVSLLMIDLDNFKQVNDSYGHETGDRMLKLVAEGMRSVFRDSDFYGRWGGDEFVAVMPNTAHAGAVNAGQRLRECADAITDRLPHVSEPISLSVGAASTIDAAPEQLLREADLALYREKHYHHPRLLQPGTPGRDNDPELV